MPPALCQKSLAIVKCNLSTQLSRRFCGCFGSFSIFSVTFTFAMATSYHSNLHFFLVVNKIKCKDWNDKMFILKHYQGKFFFSDEFWNIHKTPYIHMTPGKKAFAKRKGMETYISGLHIFLLFKNFFITFSSTFHDALTFKKQCNS